MATANTYSNYYVAPYPGESPKTYFDIDPVVKPYAKPSRTVSEAACVSDGTNAGQYKTLDSGSPVNSQVFDIAMQYVEPATYTALLSLYQTIAQVVYSPDNGTTKYRCSWMGNDSLVPVPIAGLDALEVSMRLRLQAVL